jgi:hypothetical protein
MSKLNLAIFVLLVLLFFLTSQPLVKTKREKERKKQRKKERETSNTNSNSYTRES